MAQAWVNRVWADKPSAFRDNLLRIANLDTLHDFWDPRGEASPMKNDTVITEKVRAAIKTAISATGTSFDVVKGTLNPAATDFERSAILEYESKILPSYLFAPTRKSVTFDDILSGKVESTTNAFGSGGNILEINTSSGKTFDMLSSSDRNTVGNFVLRYMFPGKALNASSIGITFDAGPVIPRKLLSGIGVFNAIFPQNIADSASTPTNAKKTMPKLQYVFPKNTLVKSNLFTNSLVDISFKNKGFGALNRYGFSIEMSNPKTKETASFPFSATQKKGPSVNYLVTSVLNGNFAVEPEQNSILKLNEIEKLNLSEEAQKNLVFDMKRMGDYEQVNASTEIPTVIFSTIDHMCSLYARMLRKPCIWSNNGSAETVLYRFEDRDLRPAEKIVQYGVSFAQEQLLRIKSAQMLGRADGDLALAVEEFERGQGGYFATTSKIPSGTIEAINQGFAGVSVESFTDQDKQVQLSNALTTYIMRLRMKDLAEHGAVLTSGLKSALTQIETSLGGIEKLTELSLIHI